VSSIFSTPELAIGIAVGGAAGAAFEPKLEVPKQTAWAANPQRLPDLGLLADLVAGGKITLKDGRNMAARLGFDTGPFDSIVWLAQNRLDFPLMLRLWRRFPDYVSPSGKSVAALLDETLAHEQLDWDYHELLTKLEHAELIGLGDIATAIVRGAVPAPSWVPVPPPTTTDKVPRFPVTDLDPVALAAKLGFDEDMLRIMTARSGLSLAPILATQALFRGALSANDWLLAIAEGDLRTEWAETLKAAARQIPTADQFVEGWLRGWLDQKGAEDGAALHGMTPAHTDLIYKVKGRPVSFHEITTGLARGGTYPSTYDDIPEPYRKAIKEADIRPEWASLHHANRYLYPSAFVLRSLAQAGDLGGQKEVEQVLLEIGWKPSFATQVSTAWTGGGTTGDKDVTSAETKLKTRTHSSYIAEEIDDATATAALTAAGVTAAAIPAILALWAEERSLIRKQLSPTQIRKALNLGIVNPATGVAWTQADATAAMLARGYDQADAEVFLQE
jgi:hypothetical protein